MVSTGFQSDIPWQAFTGGVLIGAAALLLYLMLGRIAGVSGILFGAVTDKSLERYWRLVFLIGLIAGAWAAVTLGYPSTAELYLPIQPLLLAVGGLAVGFGTRLGSGCTSGHGVCGLGRLSPRSLVAVVMFMVAGFIAASWLRPWLMALIHA